MHMRRCLPGRLYAHAYASLVLLLGRHIYSGMFCSCRWKPKYILLPANIYERIAIELLAVKHFDQPHRMPHDVYVQYRNNKHVWHGDLCWLRSPNQN